MTLTDLMNNHYTRGVREAMLDLILGRSDVEAERHRQKVLDLLMPSLRTNNSIAVMKVAERFFNGNWARSDIVVHHCTGPACCSNYEACQRRACCILARVVTTLRPKMFSRADWLTWPASFA